MRAASVFVHLVAFIFLQLWIKEAWAQTIVPQNLIIPPSFWSLIYSVDASRLLKEKAWEESKATKKNLYRIEQDQWPIETTPKAMSINSETITTVKSPQLSTNLMIKPKEHIDFDIEKAARAIAKYMQLSLYVIIAHIKSFALLIQITLSFVYKKIKLLLTHPLQLLLLPFTIPFRMVTLTVQLTKFFFSTIRHFMWSALLF